MTTDSQGWALWFFLLFVWFGLGEGGVVVWLFSLSLIELLGFG